MMDERERDRAERLAMRTAVQGLYDQIAALKAVPEKAAPEKAELESLKLEVESLKVRVQQLELAVSDHEQKFATFESSFWRRLVWWIDGWPGRKDLNAEHPAWRPWRRWWTS